jgi:uncharacterized protein involved in tolerance to divalent cations
MVNVIIYLDEQHEAKELVDSLLHAGLIANASIDDKNISYLLKNNKVVESVNSVITAQTKSLLFSTIEDFVQEKFGDRVPLYSVPITQANHSFDLLMRNNTKKV